MHENLEEQYDRIVAILISFHEYATEIIERVDLRPIMPPGTRFLSAVSNWFLKRFFSWHDITDEMKQLIDRTLSDEERSNPFSDIILSNYPIEALAEKIVHDLPNVSFVQIARLHKLKDEPLRWFNLRVLITGILAVGMFFLRSVPASLIKMLGPEIPNPEIQRIGGIVGLYESVVFFYTVLAILFIATMWSLYCSKVAKQLIARKRFIRYALGFFSLRAEMHADLPNAAADLSGPGPSDPPPPST